jgi:general secretion pathway protein K
MQMFVMGVTMAQGISMGAPIFGKAADFVQMMKGQGDIGPIMTAMGMKPIKFQSESEFAKSIATESKVFSVYAVGVVKGYKRETRVRIHTVVDFGSTPPLTSLAGLASAAAGAASAAPASGGAPVVAGQGPNAIATALQPSVGGQVLYFNIE